MSDLATAARVAERMTLRRTALKRPLHPVAAKRTCSNTIRYDALLTPEGLEGKYNQDGDGEYPTLSLSRAAWRFAVTHQKTITGYWVWVSHELSEYAEPGESA